MVVKADLENNVDVAKWELLEPHLKREALFIVDSELDLACVGVEVANDNLNIIQDWLETEKLLKVSEEKAKELKEVEGSFHFLIVQPYVFIQLKAFH